MLVMAVSTLAVSGGQAQDYARRLTRATEITQDIVDQMRLEMVSSRAGVRQRRRRHRQPGDAST
jgi:hypothetical protein